jgi:hypothetical protein
MHMLGGSTSTDVEGGTSDMEGVERKSRCPGRGNRVAKKVVLRSGVGIDDEATAEGGCNCRKGLNRE